MAKDGTNRGGARIGAGAKKNYPYIVMLLQYLLTRKRAHMRVEFGRKTRYNVIKRYK